MGTIKVLIVEDDREINQLLTRYLQREGYRTASVYSGTEALAAVKASPCHLVILDLMLPEVDGFEVLRRIREQGNTPVLILSARDQEVDKLLGLGLGADDYMTKPFSIRELVARVKAQLRRYLYLQEDAPEQETRLVYGDLELDLLTYELLVRGEAKSLTAKEFEIMKLFISNPSRVFTKAQIFRAVWQEDYLTDENTVMVHIRRLRTKIEEDPSQPVYLQTVWGIGYRLGGN